MPLQPDSLPFRVMRRLLTPLERYHDFSVEGLEHIPREGPALCVLHHSFATYDGLLLGMRLIEETGRVPWGLGDDQLFRLPVAASLMTSLNVRPASPDAGMELLNQGELVFVAPGGMREALRPSSKRYRSYWRNRKGFVRLAMRAQVPVVLLGVPAADRIFKLYDTPLTRQMYERFHLPVPVLRGVGPTLIPRPVALTGYIGAPIHPPVASPDDTEAVDAFHAELLAQMAILLARRPSN
jgi:1-acyl-sn-glycerol-3-phosphate acyltransferase